MTLAHSKVSDSYAPSEIQGELGAIIIDHIAECTDVQIRFRDGTVENLTQVQSENSMSYEAQAFASCIAGDNTTQAQAQRRALTVAKLITEMRQQVGVVYPADK